MFSWLLRKSPGSNITPFCPQAEKYLFGIFIWDERLLLCFAPLSFPWGCSAYYVTDYDIGFSSPSLPASPTLHTHSVSSSAWLFRRELCRTKRQNTSKILCGLKECFFFPVFFLFYENLKVCWTCIISCFNYLSGTCALLNLNVLTARSLSHHSKAKAVCIFAKESIGYKENCLLWKKSLSLCLWGTYPNALQTHFQYPHFVMVL